MKKSTKTMLLTAIGLILVGGCFYVGAWAAGATGFYRDFGGFTISIGLHGLQIGPKAWTHQPAVLDQVTVVQEGTAEYATGQEIPPEGQQWAETPKMTWSNGEKSGEIPLAWESLTHLDINLTAADFNIIRTESESFLQWEDIEPGTLSFTIEGGYLCLVQEEPFKGFLANLTRLPGNMEITLGLPDGVGIEEMSLHSGMGDLEIEEGTVGAATIELGLGDFKAEDVYFRWLEAQVGTGDVKLENCSADELNLYSGLGTVKYDGILNGTANMESGLGDVKLTIDERNGNALSDYSLSLSSGLGEVKVGEKSYGSSYELTIENAPLLELHTGMGDVTVKTK